MEIRTPARYPVPSMNTSAWRRSLPGMTLALLLAIPAPGADIFVSPSGRDDAPGTRAQPLRTLEAARDAVRKAGPSAGAVVLLREGRYVRRTTFELNEADSGSAQAPVVFKAAAGEKAILDGGLVIPPESCRPVTDKAVRARLVSGARNRVLQIDLRLAGITNCGTLAPRGLGHACRPAPVELFINSRPMDIARYPNRGEAPIPLGRVIERGSAPRWGDFTGKLARFQYEDSRAERWIQSRDLCIAGIFSNNGDEDILPVGAIDPKQETLTLALPHLYGFSQVADKTAWRALNLIEEIDIPGEYAVDRDSGILYFYPPGDMKEARGQVSVMEDPLVAMEGASFVRFENLIMENTRGTGFYVERGMSNVIAGCTLRNIGLVAVQIGKGAAPFPEGLHDGRGNQASGKPGEPASRRLGSWQEYLYKNSAWNREAGSGHTIRDCDIHDTGAGAVSLGGGDRKTLAAAGNTVANCDIHHVNRLDRSFKAAVCIDGVGNKILHNRIHDTPGMAIHLHGNDHLIEFNRIHHVLLDMADQGAFAMGLDPSESGHLLRYNFFHDILPVRPGADVQALLFDDCAAACATVFGNVFYRTGTRGVIRFDGGGSCLVANNIVVECPPFLRADNVDTRRVLRFMKGELGRERLLKNVDITRPPYSTRYPVLLEIYEGKRRITQPFKYNYVPTNDVSQFVDAAALDFQLKPGHTVSNAIPDFEPIPFELIGLRTNEYRKTLAP